MRAAPATWAESRAARNAQATDSRQPVRVRPGPHGRHRRLAILEGGELLRACAGMVELRGMTQLPQAALFQPERERDHVQQQPVVPGAIAREHVGLDRRTECHDLVGIQVLQWCLRRTLRPRAADAACAWHRPRARFHRCRHGDFAYANALRVGAAVLCTRPAVICSNSARARLRCRFCP